MQHVTNPVCIPLYYYLQNIPFIVETGTCIFLMLQLVDWYICNVEHPIYYYYYYYYFLHNLTFSMEQIPS